MSKIVKLDDELVAKARLYAKAENRSLSEQIEYWAKVGQIMIDNPELSYEFVRESLLVTKEAELKLTKKYARKTKRD